MFNDLETHDMMIDALQRRNFILIEKQLTAGANINATNKDGDSILQETIYCLHNDPDRYDIISFLLRHGADPTRLSDNRTGPLTPAMLYMDTDMLAVLLDYGADPNAETGFSDDDVTLYDWAMSDYLATIWNDTLPEKPTIKEKQNSDLFLLFLQHLASKYDKLPPAHLALLRARGAKHAHELNHT